QLTDELCRKSWELFQEIEAEGGVPAALQLGLIQSKIAAARVERERAVARRRATLVGANEFPDLGEAPAAVLDVACVSVRAPAAAVMIDALPPMRLAQPYEALRDASDRALVANGRRPTIFLANLGASSDFTERATFATNFFAAGGIEAISNDAFASRDALIAAFKASGTRLVCLCAADADYAREAAGTARALKAAGARALCLIGHPFEREA